MSHSFRAAAYYLILIQRYRPTFRSYALLLNVTKFGLLNESISALINGASGLLDLKSRSCMEMCVFISRPSNAAPSTSPHVVVCRDEEYLREYQRLLMSLSANVKPAEAARLMLNHADVFSQMPSHKSEDILSRSFGISRP